MKKALLLLILLFFLSSAYAAECQYYETVQIGEKTEMTAIDAFGEPLKDIIIELPGIAGQPLKAINPNQVDVDVQITIYIFIQKRINCEGGGYKTLNFTIPNNDLVEVPAPKMGNKVYCGAGRFEEDYEWRFLDSDMVSVRAETIPIYEDNCLGKDDGDRCTKSSECGGNFCVEGYCSTSEVCYDDDCKCNPETEVQCVDNTGCVLKDSKEIGAKPICSVEECVTNYQDEEDNCAKSPTILEEEENNRTERKYIILLSFMLIIILSSILIYKKQYPDSYSNLTTNLDSLLKKLSKDTEEIGKKIEEKDQKIERELELREKEKEERKKPRVNKQGFTVILNEDEYEIFPDTHTYFHTYWYRKNHGGKIGRGNIIHHIDTDKRNNNIDNLMEITKQEHDKIIHTNIKKGNREEGIKELIRIGIPETRIPSHQKTL